MANRSKTKLDKLHLADLDPQDLIAPNFRLYELTRSELASRSGIDNGLPGDRELHAAVNLARQVLQPIRDAFGSFAPNSLFRSQALERKLKDKPAGWISTSQHTQGCACDVEIVGMSTLELAAWARDNLPEYDQIICECYDPRKGPNSGWVHISLKTRELGANRRNLLSYIRNPDSGKWVYVAGLRASVA
ncbi:MAG: D-Ala-D-Ala carboxypeptidase family metallohydrolase [Chromatiaceae bacterium]|jgi:hypothetical protein|nr:D-Ala-D-Ala carboxypeptidase family metallohydrolase [Chromatiaceae bacterium]